MFLPWFQIDAVWRLTKYSKLLKKYRVFAKRLVTGVSKLLINLHYFTNLKLILAYN